MILLDRVWRMDIMSVRHTLSSSITFKISSPRRRRVEPPHTVKLQSTSLFPIAEILPRG